MASKVHLVIEQGATFTQDFYLTDDLGDPLALDNYTANATMKVWYSSSNSTSFTTAINTTAGSINLSLDAATTANLVARRYVYNVNLHDTVANTYSRVFEGYVTVTPQA